MPRDDRWTHLVKAAFTLDEARKSAAPARLDAAREVLESAMEVFPASLEPIEDFEGYAVRRLLLSLKATLDALPRPERKRK